MSHFNQKEVILNGGVVQLIDQKIVSAFKPVCKCVEEKLELLVRRVHKKIYIFMAMHIHIYADLTVIN